MITSFAQLLVELTRLIDGEDAGSSSVAVATLTQLVHMGELRVYRELRTRQNSKAWAITTTANAATLPADFVAADVVNFGQQTLFPVTEEQILERRQFGGNQPTMFAPAGNQLLFWPGIADGTTVQGRYFYRLPDLNETTLPTNAVFALAEDLFLYASLAESAPFFQQDARIPLWEGKYQRILERLNTNEQRAAFEAGRNRRSGVKVRR